MTQTSSTFSHICRLVPSDPLPQVHFHTENNISFFFSLVIELQPNLSIFQLDYTPQFIGSL
jgi:hypothetical protein